MHRITTGMDDETQVQVLSGLDTAAEVVTGYVQMKKTANASKTERSPFIPARRGNNNSRKTNAARPPGIRVNLNK